MKTVVMLMIGLFGFATTGLTNAGENMHSPDGKVVYNGKHVGDVTVWVDGTTLKLKNGSVHKVVVRVWCTKLKPSPQTLVMEPNGTWESATMAWDVAWNYGVDVVSVYPAQC
jgi:hypothetical protein